MKFYLIPFLPLSQLISQVVTTIDFQNLVEKVNQYYDQSNPPKYMISPLLPHLHSKRCIAIDNYQAVENYLSNKYSEITNGSQVLISTPCLGIDSLGNMLGSYFENIVCANLVSMHYIAVAKVWEPKDKDEPAPFLDGLPSYVQHLHPQKEEIVRRRIKTICLCAGSCHERVNAVWHQRLDIIRTIVNKALQQHVKSMSENATIINVSDRTNAKIGDSLPLYPDAAIHYRCGDNFIGHYGFLPFQHFKNIIPTHVKTIYVLAENRDRKTKLKRHLATKCDEIFESMFQYLLREFPKSIILIRRGDNIYTDFARLSYAKILICSISTFCLWPAIVNVNQAYFPQSKLIVHGNTSINLGFRWIINPHIVSGSQSESVNTKNIIQKLTNPININ